MRNEIQIVNRWSRYNTSYSHDKYLKLIRGSPHVPSPLVQPECTGKKTEPSDPESPFPYCARSVSSEQEIFENSGGNEFDIAHRRIRTVPLQDTVTLADLFDRAECIGFDLENAPAGLSLIRSVLRQSCPEQWELREMGLPLSPFGKILSPGSWDYFKLLASPDRDHPASWNTRAYLEHYEYEIATCAYITGAILTGCQSAMFLDEKRWTVLEMALTDYQSPQWTKMHCALWRIWAFCRIFGCGKGRECDWEGQRAWLGGQSTHGGDPCPGNFQSEVLDNPPESFAVGNQGGLSPEELGDMVFFWSCLHCLMRCHLQRGPFPEFLGGIQGSSTCPLVEKDGSDWWITSSWTDSLLGLGLDAVRYLLSSHDRHPLRVAHNLLWTSHPVVQRGKGERGFLIYACERRLRELDDRDTISSGSRLSRTSCKS